MKSPVDYMKSELEELIKNAYAIIENSEGGYEPELIIQFLESCVSVSNALYFWREDLSDLGKPVNEVYLMVEDHHMRIKESGFHSLANGSLGEWVLEITRKVQGALEDLRELEITSSSPEEAPRKKHQAKIKKRTQSEIDRDILVGNRLRPVRVKRGLRQRQLSEMIGASKDYISRVEIGKTTLGKEEAEKVAKVLEVPVNHILHGEGEFGEVTNPSARRNSDQQQQLIN